MRARAYTPRDARAGALPLVLFLHGGGWVTGNLDSHDATCRPPALVIAAECDPLRDESEAYARRLADAGVPVEIKRYDGMLHAFFTLGQVFDDGRAVVAFAAAGRWAEVDAQKVEGPDNPCELSGPGIRWGG